MSMLDMVCLGDSIVYGYGVDYRNAWPYLASERLGLSIMNKGENGDTSAGMNARFMEDVVWKPCGVSVIVVICLRSRKHRKFRWFFSIKGGRDSGGEIETIAVSIAGDVFSNHTLFYKRIKVTHILRSDVVEFIGSFTRAFHRWVNLLLLRILN